MKKKTFMGIMLLIAAMIFSVGGTCFAATTAKLETQEANIDQVFWPMVYSELSSGASAYLVTGTLIPQQWDSNGVSVFSVSNDKTDGTGTEMRALAINPALLNTELTGCTPIGGPQLLSGTTGAMIVYVLAPATQTVNSSASGGGTLYCIDGGTSAINWSVGIEMPNFGPAPVAATTSVFVDYLAAAAGGGLTPYCIAPPTIEWDAGGNGASIYGVSGVSTAAANGAETTLAGVSVWHRTSGAGAISGQTQFSIQSGISVVGTAPVISGNSVFIIAPYTLAGASGISIIQFDKRDLTVDGGLGPIGCGLNIADVLQDRPAATLTSDSITPTPCATGNSIFVTTWFGGVSIYYAADLSLLQNLALYNATTGVTAGPVTDGNRIVIPWTSSVSCFDIDNLSGASRAWEYSFETDPTAATHKLGIWSSPVISNGYVWVTVRDETGGDTQIHRFNINSNNTAGDRTLVATRGDIYSDPIVVGTDLWLSTYNPTVEKISQTNYAWGENYWAQFKFDAAKTGHNTAAAALEAAYVAGSDSGCFISTIK